LQLCVTVPAVLALSACTAAVVRERADIPPPDRAVARPTSIPPTVAQSYGPNGAHYPDDVGWLGNAAPHELEADCSWPSITGAFRSLKPSEIAEGATIRVRPGTLIGAGAGSSKPPVLSSLGDIAGVGQVLVCPRDGYGSVRVEGQGIRIDNCHGLALFGIDGPDVEAYFTSCSRLSVGWGIWSGMSFTRFGRDIALYEVVLGFRRGEDDTFAVRPTDGGSMTDLRRFGCVFGPTVKNEASEAHCDTIQLERTGSGEFGPFTSVDCVDFGSSNAVVQAHDRLSTLQYEHSLILGGTLPWTIFPLQPGDYVGDPNGFSGNCMDVRLSDSTVNGAVGRTNFTRVVGSTIGYPVVASQQPTVEGAWGVDPGVARWSGDDIRAVAGTDFSRESLSSNWTW
jgi:hypothetical protein